MLYGRPSRLKGEFSRDQAERGAARLAAKGVECRIAPARDTLALEPIGESQAAAGAYQMDAAPMICPKCGHQQPQAAECSADARTNCVEGIWGQSGDKQARIWRKAESAAISQAKKAPL